MKQSFIVIALVFGCLSLKSQKVFEDAVEFNDYIVEQQNTVLDAIENLVNQLDYDSAAIWSTYYVSLEQVKIANGNVQNLQPFQDDTEFIGAAKVLFNYYEQIFINEYAKFISYLPLKDPDDELFAKLNAIVSNITANEEIYDGNFMAAQLAFAQKFGFQLNDFDDEIWDD